MVKLGYIWANGIVVVELLHERASRVGIRDLVVLLPGMMNN
jgi:hypothetical protein